MPYNKFGYCYPTSGNAYIGIATIGYPYETKEYIYQLITTPLVTGKSYYTSFFLSKSDRTRIATDKIGVYFSLSQPTVPSGTVALIANPQVENLSGFLTDTINWVKIEGYFTAQGGEQYMTIGNFNSNVDTDTLFTGTNNPFFADAGTAYYYIDSVSLYDSLDYALMTNIKKLEDEIKLNVYPNPTTDILKITYNSNSKTGLQIKITDVVGREIKQMEYEEEIDISDLEKGIYFLSLYQNGQLLVTKIIIKH
jgi:hypothetical protein